MKKILVIVLFLFVIKTLPAFADDLGLGDYTRDVENAWYGQKPVTDEDFEKTVKQLEDKKNRKKIKKMKKQGDALYKDDPQQDSIKSMINEDVLLLLPVNVISSNQTEIPVGHYQIKGKKIKGKIYLEFRQSNALIGTVEAKETNDDFEQSAINFAKVLPYNENAVKLIFGSIDFNAYTLLPVKNGISGQ